MTLASSSYDYQPVTDPAERLCSDVELRDPIERIQGELASYGYRRLSRQLGREGICVRRPAIDLVDAFQSTAALLLIVRLPLGSRARRFGLQGTELAKAQ